MVKSTGTVAPRVKLNAVMFSFIHVLMQKIKSIKK